MSFSRILVKLWYPNCFTTSHDGVGVMIESSWVQTVKKFTAVFAGELERREDFIEKKKKRTPEKVTDFWFVKNIPFRETWVGTKSCSPWSTAERSRLYLTLTLVSQQVLKRWKNFISHSLGFTLSVLWTECWFGSHSKAVRGERLIYAPRLCE